MLCRGRSVSAAVLESSRLSPPGCATSTAVPAMKGDDGGMARNNHVLTDSRTAWRPEPGWQLLGRQVLLRVVTVEDCTPRYLGWLCDPQVNRFLETRWHEQSMDSIRQFVSGQLQRSDSWLFAIIDLSDDSHIGNIKVGPRDLNHNNAELSFFIGERNRWGKGLATDAIGVAVRFAFSIWGVHRLQAGVYSTNVGSMRALEKAGFRHEGRLRKHLTGDAGNEDLILYGLLSDEWVESSEVFQEELQK